MGRRTTKKKKRKEKNMEKTKKKETHTVKDKSTKKNKEEGEEAIRIFVMNQPCSPLASRGTRHARRRP